ncbi:MAG: hypothetical protein ABW110_23530 [Steroidobacteraceae bacterium]
MEDGIMPKNMPTPPWDAAIPVMSENVALIVGVILAIGTLFYAAAEVRRRGDLVPLYVVIGSLIGCIYEPMADWLVLTIWPEEHQYTYMEILGRKMPLLNFFAYFYYYAPFTLWFLRKIEAGIDRTQWWRTVLVVWLGCLLFDGIFIHSGLVIYYGPHPLLLLGVPVWAVTTYAATQFGMVAAVYGVMKGLPRRAHGIVVVLTIPLMDAAVTHGLTLPGTIAMYSTDNPTLLAIAGVCAVALSVLFVWMLAEFVCRPAVQLAGVVPSAAKRAFEN